MVPHVSETGCSKGGRGGLGGAAFQLLFGRLSFQRVGNHSQCEQSDCLRWSCSTGPDGKCSLGELVVERAVVVEFISSSAIQEVVIQTRLDFLVYMGRIPLVLQKKLLNAESQRDVWRLDIRRRCGR